MPATETTTLNRPWLLKVLIFGVLLIVFGAYFTYDAAIGYPTRGMRYASFLEYQYLDAAKSAGVLDRTSVPDPTAELTRLEHLDPAQATAVDGQRLAWLTSLRTAGSLDAAHTTIADPQKEYDGLTKEWTSSGAAKAAPKPLSPFDIPVQWIIAGICWAGVVWTLVLFAGVARKRYGRDPATQTLYLPGGATLTPADVEDFDKRKWDKFLIFLKIKPGHPTLGGKELKLDLYRHAPLEAWVLAMEATAFPGRAEETASATASTEPEPATPGDTGA